jgi:molybdate transport system substrate-binding protein
MRTIALNIALVFMLFLSSCKQGETIPENQITIYAAAGFRPALEELNKIMLDSLQIKLQINYASSGTLARQIEQGGSCDLFISANKQWVEYLADKSLVNDSAVENIAENKLVVIAPKGSDIQIPDFKPCEEMDMLVGDRVAIGNPDFVPVGRYSKMALDSIGWSFLIGEQFHTL